MRLVCIGDVGVLQNMVHIGDEAMFDELVHRLRERGATQFTGLSSNPADTVARYGIDAIAPVGFGGLDRANQELRMSRVLRAAAGESSALEPQDPAWAVIEAVRASDGVAIAGGGNMASVWPMHIFERATLGALAELFAKPLVVTGQTLGPELTADDTERIAVLLRSAALVGLREPVSHALALSLGVAEAALNVDDATFLGFDAPQVPAPSDYCLVSLASHVADRDRDTVAQAVAELLDGVAADTGLEIVFLAHFASLDAAESRGDSVMHANVAARMSAPSRIAPTTDAAAAAHHARAARLIVSSRYHPVVFAMSASVPAVGIPVDDYTGVKLAGALGNFGQHGLLPVDELLAGRGADVAARVWADRDGIAARGMHLVRVNAAASAAWWNRVAGVFAG